MKRIQKFWCFLLSTLLIVSSISPILAIEKDENWNNTIYHLCDNEEVLTNEEFNTENRAVHEFIPSYKFDLTTFIVSTSNYEDYGFDTYLSTIYPQNDLGYGINKDGIILGIDKDQDLFLLQTFGRGNEIFKKEQFEEIGDAIQSGFESDSYYGAQVAYREAVAFILDFDDIGPSSSKEDYGAGFVMDVASLNGGDIVAAKEGTEKDIETPKQEEIPLPDWYVKDPSTFTDFHNDPDTPRLVDNADIFTDEEETQIQERIKKLSKIEEDVVIYTDVTSYGIDNELFSQDFYVYNGYGFGDTFDGMILFVNMDPNNREMVTSAFGKARDTFTQHNSSALDDILYDEFKQQNYGAGVLKWFDGIDEILKYGVLDSPEWFKEYKDGTLKPNKSPIIDNENLLDEASKATFEKNLEELKDKYQVNFMIYVATSATDLSGDSSIADDNAERLSYHMNQLFDAYKIDKDCILLAYFPYDLYSIRVNLYTLGNGGALVNEKEKDRIIDLIHGSADDIEYNTTIEDYLKYVDMACAGKRLPHLWYIRVLWFIMCLIVGLCTGGAMLYSAQRKMKTVARAKSARNEVVSNSFKLLHSRDVSLGIRTSSVYSPVKSDDGPSRGSSSSSSSSSYSSSSHSSSGRSASSSRRSF